MNRSEAAVERVVRRLGRVRWIALIDAILLIMLVTSSLLGARELVSILGPLHGGNFLLLLTMIGVGVADGLWSWWFFVATLLTGGPIGAFVGEWLIRRRIAESSTTMQPQEAQP